MESDEHTGIDEVATVFIDPASRTGELRLDAALTSTWRARTLLA